MTSKANRLSPRSPFLEHEEHHGVLLRSAVQGEAVVRVEVPGELPHWITGIPSRKRSLIEAGAPAARVWTVKELEGLPWEENPLTLETCKRAFSGSVTV